MGGGIQLINRLLIYPINIYSSLVAAAPYRKPGRWRRTMKRASPLSWERSGWEGIFQPLCFCFLTRSKCRDLRLRRDIYIAQSGGWKPESQTSMWPCSGEGPPPAGTLQTSERWRGFSGFPTCRTTSLSTPYPPALWHQQLLLYCMDYSGGGIGNT